MRALLLLSTTTYRAEDLLRAAERIGVEVVVGCDRRQALEGVMPGHTWTLDLARPERCASRIVALARQSPLDAVVGLDDETTRPAALAAAALGLAHNPAGAIAVARDKHLTRGRLAAAGLHGPRFRRLAIDEDPRRIAHEVDYPCVLKPLCLAAGRGVLRADTPAELVEHFRRIVRILHEPDVRARDGDVRHLLVEDYLDGPEYALEGLLVGGRLEVLALFDKPDPLVGPTFEETLYVTPSRLPQPQQAALVAEAAAGCRALGLRTGPVHAELRRSGGRFWIVEIAPRTIGGICSRVLRFATGASLEELVLRQALGLELALEREPGAAGVMMIPIPREGILREVDGIEAAGAVPGVVEVTLTTHRGARLVPLPEGHRYLGFLFARGATPQETEGALRRAHACLRLAIE